MSGVLVIQRTDGTYQTEPSTTTAIDTDDGVYISYDLDASSADYRLMEGADIVGTYYGDPDLINTPADTDAPWLDWLAEDDDAWD